MTNITIRKVINTVIAIAIGAIALEMANLGSDYLVNNIDILDFVYDFKFSTFVKVIDHVVVNNIVVVVSYKIANWICMKVNTKTTVGTKSSTNEEIEATSPLLFLFS